MARWRPKNARRNREEWVGGRATLGSRNVLMWMSYPEDVVVHYEVVEPDTGATLGSALLRAMEAPLVGEPRRPGRIRVAAAQDVREIRELVGSAILLAQAPTPEIDFLVEEMKDFRARGLSESWLDDVPELDVTGFFAAAAHLFEVAPWKWLDEDCLVRVDAPELGLEGAVVSLLGNSGGQLGFLLFPSLEAQDAFLLGIEESSRRAEATDLGTTWLSLTYDDAGFLSPKLLADMRAHGLVAPRNAHPSPYSHGRDGKALPLRAEDLRTIEAVASSVARLFVEHGTDMFDEDDPDEPVNVTYAGVELTAPYWGHEDGDEDDDGEWDDDDDMSDTLRLHRMDRDLVELICDYGQVRFGEKWDREVTRLAAKHPIDLARDFLAYRSEIDEKTPAARFLEEFPERSDVEHEWLDAQSKSWLSVWEVIAVDLGFALELRDLLTGEERYVCEVGATETLRVGLVILTRVVEFRDICLMGAGHPQPLRPLDADRVVQAARKRLRKKGNVSSESLRTSSITEYLMDEWAEVVSDVHARASAPPALHNTDGDSLLFTVDHFALIEPTTSAAVYLTLASLEGARSDGRDAVVFLRNGSAHDPDDTTLIGRVVLDAKGLRVETNSIRRADELRERLEEIVGDDIRHRARTHSDPFARFDAMKTARERGDDPQPLDLTIPEVRATLTEVKLRHLRKWVDEPIPALDGKTPREASKSADGRRKLEVLLREIELIESQSPEELRLDLAPVRRELGFER